ncbi:MAG: exodeoxyribonuclease VII small subunit [Pseudomonadota bacterium]
MAEKQDISKMTFEQAMAELETIVKTLEQGDVALEESISIYERGDALRKRCDTLLKAAEAKIEKITTDANGDAKTTEPLELD